jgi:hypothetical protein
MCFVPHDWDGENASPGHQAMGIEIEDDQARVERKRVGERCIGSLSTSHPMEVPVLRSANAIHRPPIP